MKPDEAIDKAPLLTGLTDKYTRLECRNVESCSVKKYLNNESCFGGKFPLCPTLQGVMPAHSN